ncbi:hypothetical protein [Photobacterium damselae]|uniref:hypothetical protein n=1 Tax=Photobacterium damselae TaxID=38293 RepID=UPI00406946CD
MRKTYDPAVYLDYFLQTKSDLSVFPITSKALAADMKRGQLLDTKTGAEVATGFTDCYMLVNNAKKGETKPLCVVADARLKPTVLAFSSDNTLKTAIKDFLFTKNIHICE